MLVSLQEITKEFEDRLILAPTSLSVEEGDRIGFVGPNGAGKTTLLQIITGALSPTEGTVSVRRGASVGYLAQNSGCDSAGTVASELRSVFSELLAMQARIEDLSHRCLLYTSRCV